MLSPVIQAAFTLIPTKLHSCLPAPVSFRRWFSGKHISQTGQGEPGSVELQDAYRGDTGQGQPAREPPSLYHITALTESEERILGETGQTLQRDVAQATQSSHSNLSTC
jgi:hypothetical protein